MESYIVDAFLCNFRVRGVKFMGLLMEKETNKSTFSRVVGCLETAIIRDGVWLWRIRTINLFDYFLSVGLRHFPRYLKLYLLLNKPPKRL